MRYLIASVALLCFYMVMAKFRIDGGEEANFNEWPFACYVEFHSYGNIVTDPYTGVSRIVHPPNVNSSLTGTGVLIRYREKFYVLSAAHMLASLSVYVGKAYLADNTQIRGNYAAFVAGYFTIEFGSAHKRTISRAITTVDANTVKIPLQYVDILRNFTYHALFAYDFFLIEIQNHGWYEQRNAKFLDISTYGYNGSKTLVQCKMAGWGRQNGELSVSLQQTDIHMFDKDRCNFYFDHWEMQYQYCCTMGVEGDPVCYGTSPRASVQHGDSGSPIMCVNGRQTVFAAIHGTSMSIPIGGINVTIRAGPPANRIMEFLALINN